MFENLSDETHFANVSAIVTFETSTGWYRYGGVWIKIKLINQSIYFRKSSSTISKQSKIHRIVNNKIQDVRILVVIEAVNFKYIANKVTTPKAQCNSS